MYLAGPPMPVDSQASGINHFLYSSTYFNAHQNTCIAKLILLLRQKHDSKRSADAQSLWYLFPEDCNSVTYVEPNAASLSHHHALALADP